MELLLALVLFFAMVACWLVLPSKPSERQVTHEVEAIRSEALGQSA